MSDLMSLYGDMAAVKAGDPVLRGITQADIMANNLRGQQLLLKAMEQQQRGQSQVTGFGGLVGNVMNSHFGGKKEDQALQMLTEALKQQQGVDQYTAQLQAIQQKIAEEEALARKSQAAQAAGWGGAADAVAMGLKTPEAPRETSLIQNLRAMGVDPNSPEGRKLMQQYLTKGQTTYNVTPPTGYTFADPNNPSAGFAVIPGSPQEREMRESQEKEQQGAESKAYAASGVIAAIDRAMENIGPTTAGWGGMLADVPATDAKTLQGDLSTIQSNLAFDRLQKMRDESKTGGALGQVSNIELGLLKDTWASVQQTQKPEELKKRLALVRKHYTNFMDAINGTMPEGYDEQGNEIRTEQADESPVYVNPQTGEKIRWNGKTWVVVQ